MSQSIVTYEDTPLLREAGHFLGYGSDPTFWTVEMIREVEDIVKEGREMFENPPISMKPANT